MIPSAKERTVAILLKCPHPISSDAWQFLAGEFIDCLELAEEEAYSAGCDDCAPRSDQ